MQTSTTPDGVVAANGDLSRARPPGLGSGGRRTAWRNKLPSSRRQRRPAVMALGLLLVVVFAAVSAALAVAYSPQRRGAGVVPQRKRGSAAVIE